MKWFLYLMISGCLAACNQAIPVKTEENVTHFAAEEMKEEPNLLMVIDNDKPIGICIIHSFCEGIVEVTIKHGPNEQITFDIARVDDISFDGIKAAVISRIHKYTEQHGYQCHVNIVKKPDTVVRQYVCDRA